MVYATTAVRKSVKRGSMPYPLLFIVLNVSKGEKRLRKLREKRNGNNEGG